MNPFKEASVSSPLLTWIVRIAAGVLTVACLAYGMALAVDAPVMLGINSKLHGLVIISFGLLAGRYAASGKTGLPAFDEAVRSGGDDR